MKRLFSVTIILMMSVIMLFSSVVVVNGATSKKIKDNCIYFQVPDGEDNWGDYDTIYCHIWVDGGDEFFTWQTSHEKCQKVKKNLWKYNLSSLKTSRRITGGFDKKTTYCVIFSDNIGNQTYDLYFKNECVGDTVECTNAYRGNPIDINKKCIVARWQKNGDQYDSVEYTRESVSTIIEDNSKEDSDTEDDTQSLSQDMSMVIIFMLSVVIVLLVIILIVRSIKNKKK